MSNSSSSSIFLSLSLCNNSHPNPNPNPNPYPNNNTNLLPSHNPPSSSSTLSPLQVSLSPRKIGVLK